MTEWEGIGLFLAPLLLGATMFQTRSDCLFSKLIMEFLSSTVVILHENQACHQCLYTIIYKIIYMKPVYQNL